LEDVAVVFVFAIDPPSEIQQHFMKDGFQKVPITLTGSLLFDLINSPRCPRVDGWIYIAKRPFISRNLTIGVHVPLARHEDQLVFGKRWIDQ